ncbi:cupin-like domain-containing protein [Pendulispora brunnea]|uniref:Cupin-like domain-containing protein n=1 Tax=Pendulispora brunnea TaxID=2905690 RepID=A0ABZ2K5C1_9BACT
MKYATNRVERTHGLTADEFHERFLDRNLPIVLTDQVPRWPASRRWSIDYLIEKFGNRPVAANLHDDGMHTGHHVTLRQTTLKSVLMPMPDAPKLHSLVVHVLKLAPYLIPDFSIPTVVSPSEVQSSGFWIKPKTTTSGLHFDHQNGLLGVVRGRKRILMFSPDQVEQMYPCPIRELEDEMKRNWSSIRNVFNPDYERFPRLAEAICHEVILDEGEMLFIPKFWWHAVEHVVDMTISVNFFLRVTESDSFPLFYRDRVFIERLLAAV